MYKMRITVIGGAVLDRKYRARGKVIPATSNPVDGYRSFGGVARNIAENLLRLGVRLRFATAVGNDAPGSALLSHLEALGADVGLALRAEGRPTAEYVAVLDPDNDLVIGLADMAIFELMTPDWLAGEWPMLSDAPLLLFDCNLPAETIAALVMRARGKGLRLAVNTVSAPKALRLPADLDGIALLFTNLDEANAMLGRDDPAGWHTAEAAAAELVERGAEQVLVTQGASGYVSADGRGARRFPAIPARPLDITGAGDAMVAGTLAGLLAGAALEDAACDGALLATLTTESEASVHPDLSRAWLDARRGRLETACSRETT